MLDFVRENPNSGLSELFECLSVLCEMSSRPVVLMIDEVDSASNNQVFIDFLGQLRSYYLKRDRIPIFHSVILAGTYDIKNLKLKLHSESEHQYNSPWNNERRADIIVDYLGGQFIIELKIWHGKEYNERGEQQLSEYLEYYRKQKGYMLSFILSVR